MRARAVTGAEYDFKADMRQMFEDANIQGQTYLFRLVSMAFQAASTSETTRRDILDKLRKALVASKRPSMATVVECFSRVIYPDPQFIELMKPLVQAVLMKADVLSDKEETETLAQLRKELDAWKPNVPGKSDQLLFALLFMHTFPAYRLSNFIAERKTIREADATAQAAKAIQDAAVKAAKEIATDAQATAKIRGATAALASDRNVQYLHLEDSLSTDVTNSMVLQQLAQLKGLTPEELFRQKIQDRMSRPLAVSDVLTPQMNKALQLIQNASGTLRPGDSSIGASPAPKIKALRFNLDPEFNKLLQASAAEAMKMRLVAGSRGVTIPATIDSVRGTIFISNDQLSKDQLREMAEMSKSDRCMPGYSALTKLADETNGIRFTQTNAAGDTEDVLPLAVYWTPGLLTERTTVHDIMEWSSISKTFKVSLLALVAYTLAKDSAGVVSSTVMSTMRLFFFDERKIRKLAGQKQDEFRRARDGSMADKGNYDAARKRQAEDDEYDSDMGSDDSDADADEDDEDLDDEEEDYDEEDDGQVTRQLRQARRLGGERIVKRRVAKFFASDANANLQHLNTPEAMDQRRLSYKKPLVVEVEGIGRNNRDRRFPVWSTPSTSAAASGTKEYHLGDGTLQSFANAVQTLFEYQMGPRGVDPADASMEPSLRVVNYVAFVRLCGGHAIYRDPTNINSRFDVVLTHGRSEDGKHVMKFEKAVAKADDDPFWAVQAVRLNPATLNVVQA